MPSVGKIWMGWNINTIRHFGLSDLKGLYWIVEINLFNFIKKVSRLLIALAFSKSMVKGHGTLKVGECFDTDLKLRKPA